MTPTPLQAAQAADHTNRGAALLAGGRAAEALAAFETALALSPRLAEAHNNRGNALAALGRLPEALESYRSALALKPALLSAYANLAAVLARLQRLDEAIAVREQLLALAPDAPGAHLALAALLAAAGRTEAAVPVYETALRLRPSAEAHNDLGAALAALERFEAAARHFEQAIALNPGLADAWHNLASALAAQERHAEAVEIYTRLVAAIPGHAAALGGLSMSLEALGRPEDALARAEQAIALDPAAAHAHHAAGQALVTLGQLDAAALAFRRSIALSPRTAQFYWALGECAGFADDSSLLDAMQALARDADALPEREQVRLNFALAGALEQAGRREEAFRSLSAAAALERRRTPYDEAATLARLRRIQDAFTRERMRPLEGGGALSDTPVFIVGMPRSGTTLVEQILASHPAVSAGGELAWLPELAGEAPERLLEDDPEAAAIRLGEVGRRYLERLAALAPGAARVTDKLPSNFALAGLIRLALPGATIIHVRRDPVDTCFSCFSKLFAQGQPFAKDLGELGRYHRAYAALMEHWRLVLPRGAMVEVDYEALVGDLETQARRIVAGCGLDWDAACLDFHTTRRPVRTASAAQVRRPLYRDAIGRGRAYGDLLQPLHDALGDALERA